MIKTTVHWDDDDDVGFSGGKSLDGDADDDDERI